MKLISIWSPGKSILFGEYAVLFGFPGYARPISEGLSVILRSSDGIGISIVSESWQYETSADDLISRYHQAQELYDSMGAQKQSLPWNDPYDFLLVLIGCCLERSGVMSLDIQIHSTLEMDSGQGSSAALTISMLKAFLDLCGESFIAAPQELLLLAQTLEGFQHGLSSGLDLKAIYYQNLVSLDRILPPSLLMGFPIFSVHTGRPCVTTGQCVDRVLQGNIESFKMKYQSVNLAIAQFLETPTESLLRSAFRLNHRWLCDIGVVPLKVQQFIDSVEKQGGVAKISGSGAIFGHSAGQVLIYGLADPETFCALYQYSISKTTQGASNG